MAALLGGLGSASQAAGFSQTASLLSTGLNAVGDVISGIGQANQYNYQAQVAANNAVIQKANSDAAITSGSSEESIAKLKAGETTASQTAAQAANGIDVGVGSPVAVRQSGQNIGALDAALIHFNAARASQSALNAAATDTANSAAYKMAAGNAITGGVSKALDSIISGATSVSSKYSQYQLSGAMGSNTDTTPAGWES